jgi:hypothetical protein
MSNTNCLEGMKCPTCGNEDDIHIAAKSWFHMTDDGTDDFEDVEYDDNTPARCPRCDWHGVVGQLKDEEYIPCDHKIGTEIGALTTTSDDMADDPCRDFELKEGSVWIEAGNISVYVVKTDEGVIVELHPKGHEVGDDILHSGYAQFSEAQEVIDQFNNATT